MAKTICIFSDGTGQGGTAKSPRNSNVYKLYLATKKAAPDEQVCFYDPGLGSAEDGKDKGLFRLGYNLLSKATGLGISQNIKDCYDFLIEAFELGDRLYTFGFSRGAYTARSLGGVLKLCGIPQRGAKGGVPKTDKTVRTALIEEAVESVYKTYGRDEATKEKRRALGRSFRERYASTEISPGFIGVWDTVRALGLPGTSGLVGWRHAFHDADLDDRVPFARQALSIDENREVFAPVLWSEKPEDVASNRIKQVWFAGVHTDIGGGYAEQGLSDITLDWMVDEATSLPHPLRVDRSLLATNSNPLGLQHDERKGLGHLWIKGGRDIKEPKHLLSLSVKPRAQAPAIPTLDGRQPYRPEGAMEHPVFKGWIDD
jgi:uncharacterized protein (DUF2235 family)